MIEIKADYYINCVNVGEHVYLNENKISLLRSPYYDAECFRVAPSTYAEGWKFSIAIDGSYQTFSYLQKDSCNSWFNLVANSINL